MRIPFLAAALLLAGCEAGGTADLAIVDAWARPTLGAQGSTAAYLTIANSGGSADRLTGVRVDAPARASLHRTVHEDGMSRMRPMEDGMEIAPGQIARLRPGGPHLMISNLPAALEPGDTLAVTLLFEESGERRVDVPVRTGLDPSNGADH